MRHRLTRAVSFVVVVAGACVLGTGNAAYADVEGPGAYIGPDGSPTAVATDNQASVGVPGASDGPVSDCSWTVVIDDDFAMTVFELDGSPQYSETGRWLAQVCGGNYVDVVPEGGLVDPAALAAQARESVPIANPGINTSPDRSDRLIVQMRTWLWLDETWWRPYTATASAGRVAATVTATPTEARWSTGDGGTERCIGPGTRWRPGTDEDATDCSYIYRHSSAGQPHDSFTLTATVEFAVTWTTNAPGGGGTLAPIERSESVQVQVGEIQAVETR
jgi:hypothetical protein